MTKVHKIVKKKVIKTSVKKKQTSGKTSQKVINQSQNVTIYKKMSLKVTK